MRIEFKEREVKNLKDFCGWRIWEKPKSIHQYAIGADVAEGVGGDASCAQVIDCETGKHIASFWHNLIDTDNYAAELVKAGKWYNNAYINIECNNHGAGVIALMGASVRGLAYPNLYMRYSFDEYMQQQSKVIGFKTTQATKPRLIENLKSALRDGELTTHDKATIQELNTFVRDERTGRMGAQGSSKDDRVMSLALAWEQCLQLIENQNTDSVEPSYQPKYDEMTGFPIEI